MERQCQALRNILFQESAEFGGIFRHFLSATDDFMGLEIHCRIDEFAHRNLPAAASGHLEKDCAEDGALAGRTRGSPPSSAKIRIPRNEYVLKPILKKLELLYRTTHAMRHGAVSRFQEAGVHGDLITKWVGHTSLKMTSKYTHFSAKHRKEVVAKLGAIAS
jgi:integrase